MGKWWCKYLTTLNAAQNKDGGKLTVFSSKQILKNVTPTVVAYIIEGGAHHLDLR